MSSRSAVFSCAFLVSVFFGSPWSQAQDPGTQTHGDDVETRLDAVEERVDWMSQLLESFDIFGTVRVRHEYKDPFDYMATNGNKGDDVTLLRSRINFAFDVTEHVGAHIELQDARTYGENGSLAADIPDTATHQAFVRIEDLLGESSLMPDGWSLVLDTGRKRLPNYGDQRIISSLDWSNVGRTFDGAEAVLEMGEDASLSILYAQVAEESGITGAGKDDELTGLYFTHDVNDHLTYDLYSFWRNFKTTGVTGEDGMVGDLEDRTYGVRVEARGGGLKATLEGVRQDGDSANDNVDAYGVSAEVGYDLPGNLPWSPWIAAGVTLGSGDSQPLDGDEETFKPIAPFGHANQGHYDIFSWQNGRDHFLKARVNPGETLRVHADFHFFRLDEDADSWYNAAGAPIRSDFTGSSGKHIGRELDLYAKWSYEKNLRFWAGWSRFWAGSFVDRTGGGGNGHFFFVQMELFFGGKKR